MRSFFILIISLFASSVYADFFNDGQKQPYRLSLPDYAWGMSIIRSYDIDLLGVDYKKRIVDVLATENQLRLLTDYAAFSGGMTKGVPRQIPSIEGKKSPSKLTEAYMEKFPEYYQGFKATAPDEEYKTPEEIEAILMDYAERFPRIAKLEVIGQSFEGRNIYAMKISDNVDRREIWEPTILFNAAHHAREVMTPEVALDIIDRLLMGYFRSFKVTSWVMSNEIWVVPMVNPDGNNRVWTEDKWWRKNTRGGYGVDLNRNYPYDWGACNGSSDSTYSGTYRGEFPASEPETQALMALVENIRPVFDISYHSYSELVIYPFGCDGKNAEEIVQNIGKEIAGRLDYEPGTAWDLLYSVDGCDIDWMYGAYQVIPYVIEVSNMLDGFQPNYALNRDKTVKRNRLGWEYLLDRLKGPGVRGVVTDKDKKILSKFNVLVERNSEDDYHFVKNYRGNPDGSYHIILEQGLYRLTFRADGYQDIVKKVRLRKRRKKRDIRFKIMAGI